MLTKDLVTALSYGYGCLAKQTIIPLLSHFCFTPDQISTFNGTQGVIVDFPTGLDCALPGDTFYNLLKSLSEEVLTFEVSDNNVVVKTRNTTSTLKTLLTNRFVFASTEYQNNPSIEITDDFIKGIRKCLKTINTNPRFVNQAGITLTNSALYSTDSGRISKYLFSSNIDEFTQYLLPKTFCELLCKFSKEFPTGKMFLGQDFIIVEYDKVKLFTQCVVDVDFLDYEAKIKTSIPKEICTLAIPPLIRENIARCAIFANSGIDSLVTMNVNEMEIELETSGIYGKQKEVLSITGFPKIGEFIVDIGLLDSFFENVKEIAFHKAKKNVVIIGKDEKYLQLLASFSF